MVSNVTAFLGRRAGVLLSVVLLISGVPGNTIWAENPPGAARKPEEQPASAPPRGIILSGEKALALETANCWITNQDPDPKTFTVWNPSPADIAHLEALLPAFLRSQKTPPDFQPLHDYYRYYAGVIKGGRKTICVSFLHVSFLNHLPPGSTETDVISVLDGGGYVFRVQFDVNADRFEWVSFGGYA